ncbi:MAG: hypothetical protein EOP87_20805, partial [Verrucomicrobiaceae bacterium]
MSFAGQQDTYL